MPKIQAIAKAIRKTVALKSNGLCWYCGLPGDTVDHLNPRINGGPDTLDNYVLACKGCNSCKKDLSIEEFRHNAWYRANGVTQYFSKSQKEWLASKGIVFPSHEHMFWFENHNLITN